MPAGITPSQIYQGIYTTIATGTTTANPTMTAIPTGFKLLRLYFFGANSAGSIYMNFNDDATNDHYKYQLDGGAAGSGATLLIDTTTDQRFFYMDIQNIATQRKIMTANIGGIAAATGAITQTRTFAGCWINSTDEISKIVITCDTPVYWVLMGAVLP